MLINTDTAVARINFERAQLRLLEFKSLIDELKRNQRNVFSVEGRGCGGGGRGRGRGRSGPGRGQGRGDCLDFEDLEKVTMLTNGIKTG